jgi:hypothetical protein
MQCQNIPQQQEQIYKHTVITRRYDIQWSSHPLTTTATSNT